jgi:hypothetical protein
LVISQLHSWVLVRTENGNIRAAKGTIGNLIGAVNELRVVNILQRKFNDVVATGANGSSLQKMLGFDKSALKKSYGNAQNTLMGFDFDIVRKGKDGKFRLGEIKSDQSYYGTAWDNISKKRKGKLTEKIDAASDIKKNGGNVGGYDFYFDEDVDQSVKDQRKLYSGVLAVQLKDW